MEQQGANPADVSTQRCRAYVSFNLELVAHREQEQKEQHGADGRLQQGLEVGNDGGDIWLARISAIQADICLIDPRVASAAEQHEPILD